MSVGVPPPFLYGQQVFLLCFIMSFFSSSLKGRRPRNVYPSVPATRIYDGGSTRKKTFFLCIAGVKSNVPTERGGSLYNALSLSPFSFFLNIYAGG